MSIFISKIFVLLLLTLCRLSSGLCPLIISTRFLRKYRHTHSASVQQSLRQWIEKFVSCSMFFSGGILLATCFVHMIPEVREHLQRGLGIDEYHFPYAETLVCIGFFLVFVLEETVKLLLKNKQHGKEDNTDEWEHKRKKRVRAHCHSKFQPKNDEGSANNIAGAEALLKSDNILIQSDIFEQNNGVELNDMKNEAPLVTGEVISSSEEGDKDKECNNNSHRDTITVTQDVIAIDGIVELTISSAEVAGLDNHRNSNCLRNLLLILALSFHSLMEGLAIGLARNLQDVWYLFVAVAVHECAILLCVAVELVFTNPSVSLTIVYILAFALVSPFGVLLGMIISYRSNVSVTDDIGEESSNELLLIGVLQGLAAGTILYVTFFEILNHHKSHHHHSSHDHYSHSHRQNHRHHHHHHHAAIYTATTVPSSPSSLPSPYPKSSTPSSDSHESTSSLFSSESEFHGGHGFAKLLFIFLGFVFMVMLELLSGHYSLHGAGGHGMTETNTEHKFSALSVLNSSTAVSDSSLL